MALDGIRYFKDAAGNKHKVSDIEVNNFLAKNPDAKEYVPLNFDGKTRYVPVLELPNLLEKYPNVAAIDEANAKYINQKLGGIAQQTNAQNQIYSGMKPAGVPYAPGMVTYNTPEPQPTLTKPFPIPQETEESRASHQQYLAQQEQAKKEASTFFGGIPVSDWKKAGNTLNDVGVSLGMSVNKLAQATVQQADKAMEAGFYLSPYDLGSYETPEFINNADSFLRGRIEHLKTGLSKDPTANTIGSTIAIAGQIGAGVAARNPQMISSLFAELGWADGDEIYNEYLKANPDKEDDELKRMGMRMAYTTAYMLPYGNIAKSMIPKGIAENVGKFTQKIFTSNPEAASKAGVDLLSKAVTDNPITIGNIAKTVVKHAGTSAGNVALMDIGLQLANYSLLGESRSIEERLLQLGEAAGTGAALGILLSPQAIIGQNKAINDRWFTPRFVTSDAKGNHFEVTNDGSGINMQTGEKILLTPEMQQNTRQTRILFTTDDKGTPVEILGNGKGLTSDGRMVNVTPEMYNNRTYVPQELLIETANEVKSGTEPRDKTRDIYEYNLKLFANTLEWKPGTMKVIGFKDGVTGFVKEMGDKGVTFMTDKGETIYREFKEDDGTIFKDIDTKQWLKNKLGDWDDRQNYKKASQATDQERSIIQAWDTKINDLKEQSRHKDGNFYTGEVGTEEAPEKVTVLNDYVDSDGNHVATITSPENGERIVPYEQVRNITGLTEETLVSDLEARKQADLAGLQQQQQASQQIQQGVHPSGFALGEMVTFAGKPAKVTDISNPDILTIGLTDKNGNVTQELPLDESRIPDVQKVQVTPEQASVQEHKVQVVRSPEGTITGINASIPGKTFNYQVSTNIDGSYTIVDPEKTFATEKAANGAINLIKAQFPNLNFTAKQVTDSDDDFAQGYWIVSAKSKKKPTTGKVEKPTKPVSTPPLSTPVETVSTPPETQNVEPQIPTNETQTETNQAPEALQIGDTVTYNGSPAQITARTTDTNTGQVTYDIEQNGKTIEDLTIDKLQPNVTTQEGKYPKSNLPEYPGTVQGQPETGQGKGSQRETPVTGTDNSNSLEPGKEEEIKPETKAEKKRKAELAKQVTKDGEIKGKRQWPEAKVIRDAKSAGAYTPFEEALMYFIRGGKINTGALKSLYGGKVNRNEKNIQGEIKTRISYINNKIGKSIDEIAHWLWEDSELLNSDGSQMFDTSEYREAVEQVISEFSHPNRMAEKILHNRQIDLGEYQGELADQAMEHEALMQDVDDYYDWLIKTNQMASESEINELFSYDNTQDYGQETTDEGGVQAENDGENTGGSPENGETGVPGSEGIERNYEAKKDGKELTPIQQKDLDNALSVIDTDINAKLSEIKDLKQSKSNKLAELNNRIGLFGDTQPQTGLFDEGFEPTENNIQKAIQPFDDKIATAERNIERLRKLRQDTIDNAGNQTEIPDVTAIENKPEEKPEIRQASFSDFKNDSRTKSETLFTSDSNYDSKNITNKGDKKIPDDVIDEIADKGITIERLDNIGVPVFKYSTQVTIHGYFNEDALQRNTSRRGYKNLILNKNKSLGVRYNGIDEDKKEQIGKALNLASRIDKNGSYFAFLQDSKGVQLQRIQLASSREDAIAKAKILQAESDGITGFIGNKNVFVMSHPFFGTIVVSHVNIDAIYQKDLWPFISKITKGSITSKENYDTLKAKQEADDKAYWDNFRKETEIKEREAAAKFQEEIKPFLESSPFPKSDLSFGNADKFAVARMSKDYEGKPVIKVVYFTKERGRWYRFERKFNTWADVNNNYERAYNEERKLSVIENAIANLKKAKDGGNTYFDIDINGIKQVKQPSPAPEKEGISQGEDGIKYAKNSDGTLKTKSEYTPEEWDEYTKSVIDKKLSELPKEKKFWEMTRDEFVNHIIEKAKARGMELNDLVNRSNEKHKEFIQQALSENRPVPAEVLQDYPDLIPAKNDEPQKPRFAGEVIDEQRKQDLLDSLREGELILETGKFNDVKRTPEQLEAVKRAVESTKGKLKELGVDIPTKEPFSFSKDDVSFEHARRAYAGISFDPEKRAEQTQQDYVDTMTELKSTLDALAKSDEQKAVAEQELIKFKNGYISHLNAWLSAKSRTLSPMITGPSNFPTARNEKANNVEHKRSEEFSEWEDKARKSAINAVKGSATPEQQADERWQRIKKTLDNSMASIIGIDRGQIVGSRPLFVSNLSGFIKRMAANGQVDDVKKSLEYIKSVGEKYGKPIFSDNNAIWQLAETVQPKEDLTQKETETIAEYKGLSIENNYADERVQMKFEGKPSQEIISELKSHGFHWSPSNKAWQRKNTVDGVRAAENIARKFYGDSTPLFSAPKNNVTLQEPTPVQNGKEYKTQNGETIRYKSANALDSYTSEPDIQRQGSGESFVDSGEFCAAERIISEQKHFNLTGANKLKTPEDVAYLFRSLESAATENVFAVFHLKGNKFKVLYLSTGSTIGSVVDIKLVAAAAKEFNAESVTLVHNHPSGRLLQSDADINLHKNLTYSLKGICRVNDSIVINLDSGKFLLFNTNRSDKLLELTSPPDKETAAKVYSFDRQKLYEKSESLVVIKNSGDVAVYLSKIKRGVGDKFFVIVLNRRNAIVKTYLTDNIEAHTLLPIIGKYGDSVIIAGNRNISVDLLREIKNQLIPASSNLLDYLQVDQDPSIITAYNGFKSYSDEGFLEPGQDYIAKKFYGDENEPMFSILGNPRLGLPKVRGSWTKPKIIRELKEIKKNNAGYGKFNLLKGIASFENAQDLRDHLFYHGTGGGVSGALYPSITMSERDVERYGGGGYGQRYFSISLSKSKRKASIFSGMSRSISVYPVILNKEAKVIDRPDIQDSVELEDEIEELWNNGVDAVRLGDWNDPSSEMELAVLNPNAISTWSGSDSRMVYGTKSSDFVERTDEELEQIIDKAKTAIIKMEQWKSEHKLEPMPNLIDYEVGVTSREEIDIVQQTNKQILSERKKIREEYNSLKRAEERKLSEGIVFSIIGERGAKGLKLVTDNLNIAKQMTDAGKNAKTIFLATGWEKFPDGWKYDLPDNFNFNPIDTTSEISVLKLNNLIEFPELFDSYPQLQDYTVTFINDVNHSRNEGTFDEVTKTFKFFNLQLSGHEGDVNSRNAGERTILHEIQHAIQQIEGFSRGTSPQNALENYIRAYANAKGELNGTGTESLSGIKPEIYNEALESAYKETGTNTERDAGYALYKRNSGETEARNAEQRFGLTPEQRKEQMLSETQDVSEEQKIYLQEAIGKAYSIPERNEIINLLREINTSGGSHESITAFVEQASKINPDTEYLVHATKQETIDAFRYQPNVEWKHFNEVQKNINIGSPGFFSPNHNRIFICSENVSNASELVTAFLHETAHAGVKANVINTYNIFENLGEDFMRAAVDDFYFIGYTGSNAHKEKIGNEFVASIVEQSINNPEILGGLITRELNPGVIEDYFVSLGTDQHYAYYFEKLITESFNLKPNVKNNIGVDVRLQPGATGINFKRGGNNNAEGVLPGTDEAGGGGGVSESQGKTGQVRPATERPRFAGEIIGSPLFSKQNFSDVIQFSSPEKKAVDWSIFKGAPKGAAISEIGFYSTVEKALNSISQGRGTPEQFKAMLLKNGAKQAEMDWMGWDERFTGKTITKFDIQDWIDQNRIEVKEVVKMGRDVDTKLEISQNPNGEYYVYNLATAKRLTPYYKTWQEAADYLNANKVEQDQITKYSKYQLPGGENYRELLLTMPVESKWKIQKDQYGIWIADGGYNGSEHIEGETRADVERQIKEYDRIKANNDNNNSFKSPHFDEPNILAHVRFNDRTDTDGKRVLFVEEFQSDWAQKGKKEGFREDEYFQKRKEGYDKLKELGDIYDSKLDDFGKWIDNNGGFDKVQKKYGIKKYHEIRESYTQVAREKYDRQKAIMVDIESKISAVPSMPFQKTDQWLNLAMRRMIRYAAENGYDRIAWTNGEQQAERYDLSKQIETIEYKKKGTAASDNSPMYDIKIYDKNKREVINGSYRGDELENVVGKEVAQKIINGEGNAPLPGKNLPTYLTGIDLKVGGEGMKAFYDSIVPNAANKFGKAFGAKVENVGIQIGNEEPDYVWTSDTMGNHYIQYRGESHVFKSVQEVKDFINQIKKQGSSFQSLPITPAMRESAVNEGMPLFKAPKASQKPTSINPDVQKNMEDANGINYDSTFTKIKRWLGELKTQTQHFEHITQDDFPESYDKLRQLQSVPEYARHYAVDMIRKIVEPIAKDKVAFDIFSKYIIINDLHGDIISGLYDGKELPWGYKDESEVIADINTFSKAATANPKIWKAIKDRIAMMANVRQQLVDLQILPEETLKNHSYFHHQVLDFMNLKFQGTGTTSSDARLHKKGWQHGRTGSMRAYNTNYLESEFEVLAQSLSQIETKKILNEIGNIENIAPALRVIADSTGQKITDLMPEGYVMWYPKAKTIFARGRTYIERAMASQIKTPEELNLLNEMEAQADEFIWIVRKPLADQMDSMRDFDKENILIRGMRWANSSWKQWVLLNPYRFLKYNLNNFSGDLDIVLAYKPSILKYAPQAIKELYQSLRHGEDSKDIQDCMRYGVITSGLTIQEIPDINKVGVFKSLTGNENFVNKYWQSIRNYSQFRENMLRLAAFKFFRDNYSKAYYGVSKPSVIDKLPNPTERAAKLARELIGDYGNLSQAGQWLRSHVYPFWSWVEINAPRYYRLLRNTRFEGNKGKGFAGSILRKTGFNLIKLGIKVQLLLLLVSLWNRLRFPDEEKEMRKVSDRQPKLILGRNDDGSIRALRVSGAFADMLSWAALEDLPEDIADVSQGKTTVKKKATEAGIAFVNKAYQGLMPFEKTAAEILSGYSTYPNVLHPLPIRDKTEHASRMFSLDKVYRYITKKPLRGMNREAAGLLIYNVNPGEAAYYVMRQKAFDYMKENDIDSQRPGPYTDASNYLYYYKQALKYGNAEIAKHWYDKYAALKGNDADKIKQGINKSIENGRALNVIKNKEQRELFLKSLDQDDREILEMANKWYDTTYKLE